MCVKPPVPTENHEEPTLTAEPTFGHKPADQPIYSKTSPLLAGEARLKFEAPAMISTDQVITVDPAAAYLAGPSGAQTPLYSRIRPTADGDSKSELNPVF